MKTLNFLTAKVLLCAVFLFFACSDKMMIDQELQWENPVIPEDATFVSAKQAIELANAFFDEQNGSSALISSTW